MTLAEKILFIVINSIELNVFENHLNPCTEIKIGKICLFRIFSGLSRLCMRLVLFEVEGVFGFVFKRMKTSQTTTYKSLYFYIRSISGKVLLLVFRCNESYVPF